MKKLSTPAKQKLMDATGLEVSLLKGPLAQCIRHFMILIYSWKMWVYVLLFS